MLSIIIVNYKTPSLTLDCIRSVVNYEDISNFELIVVDNYSNDGLEQLLQVQFPFVQFLQMGYNSGFARANNKGLKAAKGDCFLLLNSDTITSAHAITNCYRTFQTSGYVACGLQLLYADGSAQTSGYFIKKGGLNFILQLPFLGKILKWSGNVSGAKKPGIQEVKGVAEVDWINGAFLMVKKNAVEKAGLLDEDFFLYSEEVEWCSRLRKQGKLCIYGDYTLIHLCGESAMSTFNSTDRSYSNIFDKKGLQIMLSSFVRIRKEFGVFWFLINLFVFLAEIPFLLLMAIFTKKYNFRLFVGFCKNVFTVFSYSPVIIKNKPHFYKVL